MLGPLSSEVDAQAFLGCEVLDGVPQPDRPLVIVWVPDEVVGDADRLARLQRETAVVTQLEHPHVARVFGVQQFDEGWARLVQYVDGEPLRRVVDKLRSEESTIALRLVGRILRDVCDGVHYVHQHGMARASGQPIVHGGIRPDTVLIAFEGTAVVSGYGASALAPFGQNSVSSTPDHRHYFAPEQILGGKATASIVTDVYGVSALLYELVTGRVPYRGSADVEQAVLTGDLAMPGLSGTGDALLNVALRGLSRRGSDRFTTVKELDDAIQDVLQPEGLASPGEVSTLLDGLFAPDSHVRRARRMLLDFASDPDTSTVLTLSEDISEIPGLSTIPPFPSRSPEAEAPPGPDPALEGPSTQPDGVPVSELPVPSVVPVTGTEDVEMLSSGVVESLPAESQPPLLEPAPSPGAPSAPASSSTAGESSAAETPWDRSSAPAPSERAHLAEALAQPAAQPKSRPTRPLISEITNFDRRSGDGSRYALFAVLAAAAGILAFIVLFPKEPPEGLDELTRTKLPPELVQAALDRADTPTEVAEDVPEGATGAAVIHSDPPVDVYDGTRKLGRTPLTAVLPVGQRELRFTDGEQRINAYRRLDVEEEQMTRLDVRFERFDLSVSGPRGAEIFINGQREGRLPLERLSLYEGEYLVEVHHEGRRWADRVGSQRSKSVAVALDVVDGNLVRSE